VRNNKKERKQQGRKKKTRRKKEHGRNFILELKIAHSALLSFFAVALCYSVISLLNLNASTGSKQIGILTSKIHFKFATVLHLMP
jgi:hypothetical protein